MIFHWKLSSFEAFIVFCLVTYSSVSNLSKIEPMVAEIFHSKYFEVVFIPQALALALSTLQPRTQTNKFYKNKNFQIQKKRTTESTMDLEASLNQVLQVLRNSGLHFSAQETPYSLYISIRKKFKQNREASAQFVPIPSCNHDEKIDCSYFTSTWHIIHSSW